jgi:hypothetical protein
MLNHNLCLWVKFACMLFIDILVDLMSLIHYILETAINEFNILWSIIS